MCNQILCVICSLTALQGHSSAIYHLIVKHLYVVYFDMLLRECRHCRYTFVKCVLETSWPCSLKLLHLVSSDFCSMVNIQQWMIQYLFSDNISKTMLVVFGIKRIYAYLQFVSQNRPVICVSFDFIISLLFVVSLGRRYVLLLCLHQIQIADHCAACMQAVYPGLQCFRSHSYSY